MNLYLVAAELSIEDRREFAVAAGKDSEAISLVRHATGSVTVKVLETVKNVLSCDARILFECGK